MSKKDDELIEELEKDVEEGVPEDEADDPVAEEVTRMAGDVPVQLVAVLGKKTVSVKELIGFKTGHVLDLGRPANEVVDLVANGKPLAKGELVEIDGKLGVRIVKMLR